MTWIRSSFQWAEGLYSRLFADWLHINFVIRTVLLLLMLWLIIYVAALIFKYLAGPFVVLVYINIFKRAWNFLITETIQEWIYIHYYSKGDMKYSSLYLRLTDRVKHNRTVLSYNKYKGILHQGRVRRLGNQMMITAGIIVTLWVAAFGLNQEYAMPAWAANENPQESSARDDDQGQGQAHPEPDESENNDENENTEAPSLPDNDIYVPGLIRPGQLPAGTINLALTEEAREGARLRSGPGTAGTTVIEWLWGEGLLTYLGYYVPDPDVETLYWMRVLSPSGMEGYIGSHLVEIVE